MERSVCSAPVRALLWGRFATCRREEAGCKPAPRGSALRPSGRLAGCPLSQPQVVYESRLVACEAACQPPLQVGRLAGCLPFSRRTTPGTRAYRESSPRRLPERHLFRSVLWPGERRPDTVIVLLRGRRSGSSDVRSV